MLRVFEVDYLLFADGDACLNPIWFVILIG